MKFLISIFLSALLAFAFGLYLPWWSISVAAFIVAVFIIQKPLASFLSGFLGIFVLWLALTARINSANGGLLAPKISMIMGFGDSPSMLILITCIVGALTGGLGALTGSLLVKAMGKEV